MGKCDSQRYFAYTMQNGQRGAFYSRLDGYFLFFTEDSLGYLIKTHKIYFQKIFFQAILVASIYDLKIDFIMFDPPHFKLIVFVNPVYSQVCEHRL